MKRRSILGMAASLAVLSCLSVPAFGQDTKVIEPDLARLAGGKGAQVYNRALRAAPEDGRAVARLDARPGDGLAVLDGVLLADGTIEVDLQGRDVAQQSFVGIAFHVVDSTTYDAVYFRPFNFRAQGAEQRSHAVQYISHPQNTWQKLRAERTGQFEKGIDPPPDPNGWFRARIVLAGSKVEVYVNRATVPSLVVEDLGAAKSGGVALWAGNGSDGAYASLTIAPVAPTRFEVSSLTPAVHRLAFPSGMKNNVLVFSGKDGALIVDSGFSEGAVDDLRKTIAGFSPAGVRYVVNSHLHADHVAGNAIAPSPEAIITSAALGARAASLPVTRQAAPLQGRSGRPLPLGYTLAFGGTDIVLIPRPGLHSDADLLVYFPSASVVAMGDLLLSESVPALTDLAGYLAFLDDVLDAFPANTTFVSGHGRDLTAEGVRAYRDALKAMIGIVKTNLAAGKTADEMVKDDVLKAYKAQYSLLEFLTPDRLIPRAVAQLQQGTLK